MDIRVEGHTDNIPIHNELFHSNWVSSTARATAVATMLMGDAKIALQRMSIAGYAQFCPTSTNETLEGRRGNRRVDLVMLSKTTPSVRLLGR